jgi:hypothetical protein
MLRQPVPCCGWAATAMDCWLVVLPGRPPTPPDREPAARGRGAVRRRYPPVARMPRLGSSSSSREGRPIRSRAIASICCFRRFTLIGPSALAQPNSLGSIGGQKTELRDLIRRPPCTERLTATNSAPPPRESAMGRSQYGPSATVTPDRQLYCEACFIVSDHGCIRTILYARVLIQGSIDVTSPPGFL